MHEAATQSPPKTCPRCTGLLVVEYDGDRVCIVCGEYWYAPPAGSFVPTLVKEAKPRKRGRPSKGHVAA
jgi:hypothetical protein